MAQVCIPKEVTELIKKNIPSKAIRSITALDNTKRNAAIAEILDSFDEKNLFSDNADRLVVEQGIKDKILEAQKDALIKSAEYKRKVKTEGKKQPEILLNKINKLSNLDDITDDLIQEGIEIKLGVRLTGDEVQKLTKASENVGRFLDADGGVNEFGRIDGKYTDEFGQAYMEYKQTIDNVNPSSFGKKFVSTANANLLFNLKSGLTNIIANTGFWATASADRTVDFGVPYKMDKAFSQAIEDAKFFAKYGFDPTRALDIDSGVKTLGETMNAFNTEGTGVTGEIEKLTKMYNDAVYKFGLSVPDQFYSSFAKHDTINRLARNRIKEANPNVPIEQLETQITDLINDATAIKPKTDLGIELKEIGIAEANRVTFQQQNILSEQSNKIRSALDDSSKKLLAKIGFPEDIADAFKAGTYLVPFVMTPANAIYTGLDYSGILPALRLPKAVMKGMENAKNRQQATEVLLNFARDTKIQRPAIGIGLALGIASLIPPENYIGEYPTDPNEQRLIELGRASTNSIKLGDKWVSLDYLGPVAAPLVGILNLKKNPDVTMGQILLNYAAGAAGQLTKLPVIEGVSDAIKGSTEAISQVSKEGLSIEEAYKDGFNAIINFMAARSVPSIVGDVGESIDTVKRDTKTGQYSIYGINLDPAVLKIPGLREGLPEKRDVFGEEIKTEGLSQIFFGARVKTPSDDKVVLELQNMANEGVAKTPTDYIGRYAQKYYNIPDDKLNEEKAQYGKLLYEAYNKTIESSKWDNLNLDDKKDALSKAETKVKDKYKNELKKRYGQVKTEE
jgi:hypothetical protein